MESTSVDTTVTTISSNPTLTSTDLSTSGETKTTIQQTTRKSMPVDTAVTPSSLKPTLTSTAQSISGGPKPTSQHSTRESTSVDTTVTTISSNPTLTPTDPSTSGGMSPTGQVSTDQSMSTDGTTFTNSPNVTTTSAQFSTTGEQCSGLQLAPNYKNASYTNQDVTVDCSTYVKDNFKDYFAAVNTSSGWICVSRCYSDHKDHLQCRYGKCELTAKGPKCL
ncbi:hypothetical protein chiPu_0019990 [Chiloscyllium punctatum]|uniref:Uncharacterized protein n=1 Tax=Chiloscyllium punctatum TaxID=137246 RepID=A0A401RTQ0_CHIPU|nr:hypothetical protein [Chiloscyllium punctatum]